MKILKNRGFAVLVLVAAIVLSSLYGLSKKPAVGMVFTREDWIFSTMRVSLFCSIRVWGPIWMDTIRVSSRSWSFFSKRLHI